jgi:hypothetical protein
MQFVQNELGFSIKSDKTNEGMKQKSDVNPGILSRYDINRSSLHQESSQHGSHGSQSASKDKRGKSKSWC